MTLTTMHGHMKPGTLQLYLSTSNIEAAYQKIKAKDVELTSDIKDDLYGPGSKVKWFSMKDPDGNVWMIVQS